MTMLLPRHAASAGSARRQLRRLEGVPDDSLADVQLLVSELVGNAVRHASGDRMTLTAEVAGSGVHVALSDDDPRPPVRRGAASDATSGRGMAMVELLAARWGVTQHVGDGKTVWFDVCW